MCDISLTTSFDVVPPPSFSDICSSLYKGRTFKVITFLVGLAITSIGVAALLTIPGVNVGFVIGTLAVGILGSGALAMYGRDMIEKVRNKFKKQALPFGTPTLDRKVNSYFSTPQAQFLSTGPVG